MPAEWYYEIDGDFRGPVDWLELRRLARAGPIGPGTMVRRGREEWVLARHVAGLFEGVASEPSPEDEPVPRYDDPRLERPIRRLDDRELDEDYRLPPPRSAGGGFVTAYGVATLVLAGLLTLGGCVSGVGSLFCFAGFSSFQPTPPPSSASGSPGSAAAASGCGALLAAAFLAMALVLAIVTVVHLILAGGHFTVGIGVLHRRAWARILALVVSFFSIGYGGYILYLVGATLAQNGAPGSGSDPFWLTVGGVVGLLFVVHAVLTWVVMFNPSCASEFQRATPRRPRYPEE